MKIAYDVTTDTVYIKFKGNRINESNKDKNDNIIIDYAADGSVVGIEILDASKKFASVPVEFDFI
jgi:uncharacterized protein YuzE